MIIIVFIVLSVLTITGIIVIYNYLTAPIIKIKSGKVSGENLISVLIPARNEEKNISNCLQSVLEQDYSEMEILVLDDNSEDNTYLKAAALSNKDKRIKVLNGKPLPAGFTGKNWACHQLSQSASGKYLLFIDADVTLEKGSILSAFEEVKRLNLGLLSVFPSQKIKSAGEWLIVPLMNWLLLTFLPLYFVYSDKSHSLAAANGQFMFFERSAYKSVGGHYSSNSIVAEDVAFARLLKQKHFLVKTYLGGELISCRMYSNFKDSFEGFSKNFYPGSGLNPSVFLILTAFLTFCFNIPIILAFINKIFILPLMLIILQRILISDRSRQHFLINLLFHPLQMIMFFLLGINSVIVSKKKKRQWKGRSF